MFRLVSVVSLCLVLGFASFASSKPQVQSATISVTSKGFSPASVSVKAGAPVRLTFVRKTEATCATSVQIPQFKINKTLPLNKPVVVTFTPRKAGMVAFACPMNMIRGQLTVK
jgi:plastocyanin domain-containing protein